ncbi:MAG: tRNA 2-thiouridine(34) synthase MnmA [Actinobacteria bacterium]|nr:tRNA 2-thiouridine(34) synthase MnmA [Actinomycetota bacterium]MCL5447550.1 tRNA 2-thiouridine(34) synthase MnmA [Actinomycetota bacterium]
MKVLVAMSGGVDSSVAAAVLVEQGHEVVGVTLRLWGGASDSGCCSLVDVEDARRVARTLGIVHHVIDESEVFAEKVVVPYVDAHAAGITPNPCIECNRYIKFRSLLERAARLGYDAVATGHYARVQSLGAFLASHDGSQSPDALPPDPRMSHAHHVLLRGVDPLKDQSYVLSSLTQKELASVMFPVGEITKEEVRKIAASLRLATATKPDSLDVCFVASHEGRRGFLSRYIDLHPGDLVDAQTAEIVGKVDAVELLTPGQRKGLGLDGTTGRRRYVLSVDVAGRKVTIGTAEQARELGMELRDITWTAGNALDGVPCHVTSEPGDSVSCGYHTGAWPSAGMSTDGALMTTTRSAISASRSDEIPSNGSGSAVSSRHMKVLVQTSAHGRVRRAEYHGGKIFYENPEQIVSPGQTVAMYSIEYPEMVVGSGIVSQGLPL